MMDWKTVPGNKRGCTALLGLHMLYQLSYGLIVRKESNLRPYDYEVTAPFTTGVLETTIREQAIAETPTGSLPCRPGSALPLSYQRT